MIPLSLNFTLPAAPRGQQKLNAYLKPKNTKKMLVSIDVDDAITLSQTRTPNDPLILTIVWKGKKRNIELRSPCITKRGRVVTIQGQGATNNKALADHIGLHPSWTFQAEKVA